MIYDNQFELIITRLIVMHIDQFESPEAYSRILTDTQDDVRLEQKDSMDKP